MRGYGGAALQASSAPAATATDPQARSGRARAPPDHRRRHAPAGRKQPDGAIVLAEAEARARRRRRWPSSRASQAGGTKPTGSRPSRRSRVETARDPLARRRLVEGQELAFASGAPPGPQLVARAPRAVPLRRAARRAARSPRLRRRGPAARRRTRDAPPAATRRASRARPAAPGRTPRLAHSSHSRATPSRERRGDVVDRDEHAHVRENSAIDVEDAVEYRVPAVVGLGVAPARRRRALPGRRCSSRTAVSARAPASPEANSRAGARAAHRLGHPAAVGGEDRRAAGERLER